MAGLTVPEIARLLLVGEATMAARLTRAKQKIRTAGIPLAVPPPAELRVRAEGVLTVVYLLFTEGYRSYRDEVAAEAIRIGRLLHDRLGLLDFELPGHLLPATRAEMLLRLGRRAEAVDSFDAALRFAPTDTERDHLRRRRESASGTGTGWSPVPVPAAEHPFPGAIRARCVAEPRRDVR